MTKFYFMVFIALNIVFQSMSQETPYFNNVYNHENGITTGLSIVESGDGYIGYGATIVSGSIGQKLVFIKISHSGEEWIWKQFGNDYQTYYPGNVGGALIKTIDNNFVLAFNYTNLGNSFGSLLKLDSNLDTIWEKDFAPYYITNTLNCIQTSDNGFMLTGWVYPSEDDYSIPILMKTDSLGNYQWHQIYDGPLAKRGQNVIETPDGGYLIGGLRWNPAVYQTLDAMLIKTDSLGNEEWTKFYGNPTVDDDMALVAMADDGNYLVVTVYGEWIFSSETRVGRVFLMKIDTNGNTIWEKKIGPDRISLYIKNLRKLNNSYLLSGFSKETDSATFQYYSGWMMKLNNNLDSIWYRDYLHGDENWESFFYDASPTSDNGYIAVGYARPDMGGNNKMWVVKVDSMGCDTAGCATGVQVFDIPADNRQELWVWPNPAHDRLIVTPPSFPAQGGITGGLKNLHLYIYNSQGVKVEKVTVRETKESISINCMDWQKGLYLIRLGAEGINVKTAKIIVH